MTVGELTLERGREGGRERGRGGGRDRGREGGREEEERKRGGAGWKERIERGRKELIWVSSYVSQTHTTYTTLSLYHTPTTHTHLINHSVLPCVPALPMHDTTVKVPLHGKRHISCILARIKLTQHYWQCCNAMQLRSWSLPQVLTCPYKVMVVAVVCDFAKFDIRTYTTKNCCKISMQKSSTWRLGQYTT